jgi:sorbitol/mannitol transport system substrate-binding protein
MIRIWAIGAVLLAAALGFTGCSAAGAGGGGAAKGAVSLRVAIVSNQQMTDVQKLTSTFEREHPDIKVSFITLPENEARAKITASVATQSNEFDVVMISNYETPIWARNGWLTNLQPYAKRTAGYDPGDFIPSIRNALSLHGDLYSVPFYGESSFLAYRKDLFAKAGLKMPAHPTWPQVAAFARKLNDKKAGRAGICLRGLPGWGENLAPLDTVINTFGGRWYDLKWKAQVDSPAYRRAVQFYVGLVQHYGEPGAAAKGFAECATDYGQGNAAMWYDASSAAGTLESKDTSKVVGRNGYVEAPRLKTKHSGWLYSWSLGIPATTSHKDAAWKFVAWATSKPYIRLVGKKLGWPELPPGSRLSTYRIPEYRKAAKAFAQPTLYAIEHADQRRPTVDPVPYVGIQFLDIPEFQDLGTRVAQQFTAAIAGQQSVAQAIDQAQKYAQIVGKTYAK